MKAKLAAEVMGQMTPETAIWREYGNSKNLMTPYNRRIGSICSYLSFETSWGYGMEHNRIYGLSVVRHLPNEKTDRCSRLSRMFYSQSDRRNFVRRLQRATRKADQKLLQIRLA